MVFLLRSSKSESEKGIATIKGLATEEKAFMRTESRIVEAAQKNLSLKKIELVWMNMRNVKNI